LVALTGRCVADFFEKETCRRIYRIITHTQRLR
jgi:hypothetical protein